MLNKTFCNCKMFKLRVVLDYTQIKFKSLKFTHFEKEVRAYYIRICFAKLY